MVCKNPVVGFPFALRFVRIKGLKRQLQAFSCLYGSDLPEPKSEVGLTYEQMQIKRMILFARDGGVAF